MLRDVFEYKRLPYYNFGIIVNECGKNVHMGVNSYQFVLEAPNTETWNLLMRE